MVKFVTLLWLVGALAKADCARCGFCTEDSQLLRVKLHRVCAPSGAPSPNFDMAKHPTLVLEAEQAGRHAPITHWAGPMMPPPVMGNKVVANADLRAADLSGPKSRWDLILRGTDIAKQCEQFFPDGEKPVEITAYVCDDTNGNGRCSDEDAIHQLTVHSFKNFAFEFPSALIVDVWAGSCPEP